MPTLGVLRTLITGMSGTGKSTVIAELSRRGFCAIDFDTDEWCEWGKPPPVDGLRENLESDWIWREEPVRTLLSAPRSAPLFISGCAPNQGTFYGLLDRVVLLTAHLDVLLSRVDRRTSNPYGKSDEERAQIIENVRDVEPLLYRRATLVVDTSRLTVAEVVDHILGLAAPLDD